MNFADFALSNFRSTTMGDNIVVTFTMRIAETINGSDYLRSRLIVLSVWKEG